MEMGFQGISKDQLAETRARRLLFNENPANKSMDFGAAAQEVFVRGLNTPIQVEGSVLPALFQTFGNQPARFMGIAWIDTVMRLRLSGCVVEVITLRLELEHGALKVQFHGRRRKEYTNQPAYEIRLIGQCLVAI